MTKSSKSTPDKGGHPDSFSDASPSEAPRRIPLWQAVILPIAAILIFFLLLEGGLALLGVKPALQTEDPFVGFASNVPLFIPSPGPGGGQIMTTSPNKLGLFNAQSFQRQKPPGTFRIFCLGGSTTYGRPYNDKTAFSGWLRDLLPLADGKKHWEVINAGGISYASYRAAHLMEELLQYQPDLFIIYTGQNEFLEERTYGKIKEIPSLVRSTISLLARTRTWSAMDSGLKKMGLNPKAETGDRDQLRGEVNAILDRSAGLNRYTRDDRLRDNILEHYRISLERMVGMARSVGAKVILVTPASNLKDCSPFKSEHTEGLDQAGRQRSEQLLAEAKEAIRRQDWTSALSILDQAVALDPRYAELLYRRGRVLLALGRFDEALAVLEKARDEDVCPLRALTQMPRIVKEVAREEGTGLTDYVGLLAERMQKAYGIPIPGKEYFLDHVHPTIEGHKILALALIRTMIDRGLVHPGEQWGDRAIAAVSAKIEGGIDQRQHAQALINLARVLLWAGKTEDAQRLAEQALAKAGNDPDISKNINATLARIYQKQGDPTRALQLLEAAVEKTPASIELHYMLGVSLLEDGPYMNLEAAAANLLLICKRMPFDDAAYQYFALAMAKRGRMRIAHASLLEALRINPENNTVKKALDQFPELPGDTTPRLEAANILLDEYPSRSPRKLEQVIPNADGRPIPDGIMVEWYENGRLKRFLDFDHGVQHGLEMTWDPEGRPLSRVEYRHGKDVNSEP